MDGDITRHFSREEFRCRKGDGPCPHCGGKVPPDSVLFPLCSRLEQLRLLLGSKPITINSAYRCKERNAELPDAAPTSQHLCGNAVDIAIEGGREAVMNAAVQAAKVGFNGIGIDVKNYRYIHIDLRAKNAFEPISVWFYK